MTKAIKKQDVKLPVVSSLEEFSGQGTEHITARDTKLPILKLIGNTSPVLNPSDSKYNEDAKLGDIYNEVTGSLYRGKDGCIVEIEMPEIVEVSEIESVEMEQPEELNNSTMEEDLVEINDEIIENVDEVVEEVAENKENNNEAKETETNDGGDEKSELSKSSETEVKSDDSKVVKKSKSKDSKKSKKDDAKKSTVEKKEPKSKTKTVVQKPKTEGSPDVLSVDSLGHMVLPAAYLQVLQDTIKIVETVSITQDMIYEQNTYDLVQSSFESSFGGDSADRFDSLLGVQSRYQSPTYRSSGR